MKTSIIVLIVLCSILVIFITLLSLIFMRFRSRSRHPSSSNPHMQARWNHMDTASRRAKAEAEGTFHEEGQGEGEADAEVVDEFGVGGGIVRTGSAGSGRSGAGAIPGTGPNGTRTFLKGWFGLDEPTFSGFNNSVDQREKDANGDLLPMTNTGAAATSRGEHRPLPRDEDEEWEVASVGEHGRASEGERPAEPR